MMVSNVMTPAVLNICPAGSTCGETGRSRPSSALASQSAARLVPAANRVSTTYRSSPAITAQVKRQYVDFISRTVNPQAASQYKTVLNRNDPVRNWARLTVSDGFRPGDTADALASYWILNWMIANGETQTNPAYGRAVKQQVRGVMASNPAFARLNEAQRQEMAEVLMLNFLTQHAGYLEAHKRRDQALLRRLGDAATTRFRNEMGVDLRRLELTDRGFVRRG